MEQSTLCREVAPEMAAFAEAFEVLRSTPRSLTANAATLLALGRLRASLDCYASEVAVEFDQWGEWAGDGAKTAPAWLDTFSHAPKGASRAALRRGQALSSVPSAAAAWAEGAISAEHLDALLRLRTPVTEAAFERDEELLVEQAKALTFRQFTRALAYWELHADPDGATESEMAKRDRRDFSLLPCPDGFLAGGVLDPVSGAIVDGELTRLEAALFEADWKKAKEELGRDPKTHELCRTSAQRRCDALVEMATRSKTAPANGKRPEPLFSFLVGYETMHGRIAQLSNGTVLPPDSVLHWLDTASFERAVFSPKKRIEVSETSRFFTGATRRAIELRDLECAHHCCDIAAERCEIDHVIPYTDGGPTDQGNGEVCCSFHNKWRWRQLAADPPPDG
jgi:Domain of unknown function (DUF222)